MSDYRAPRTPELWVKQDCPVEGCRYEWTDQDGCGLAKLQTVEQALAQWDAGDPVQRGCLAIRRSGDAYQDHLDEQAEAAS